MPFSSRAQQRWGHSPSGVRALGGDDKVKQWDDATPDFNALPERAGEGDDPVKREDKWLAGAVHHPGALSQAAKRSGRSKLQEANVESNSSDPSIRARGALGKRFIKKQI